MNLHHHPKEFQALIQLTSKKFGILPLYVEKDYFVVFALKQLAESPYFKNGIFKGGTSLSKAYKLIERFSEDIDLAIVNDAGNEIGGRNLMRLIEKTMTRPSEFTELKKSEDPRVHKQTRFRRSVHRYPRRVKGNSFGQASDVLLLEINRFTPSWPFEPLAIQTYIADFLTGTNQLEVITRFGLDPFRVNVMAIERTFAEKVLGIVKRANMENPLQELSAKIRHIYDLHFLVSHPLIQDFLWSSGNWNLKAFSIFKGILEDEAKSIDPQHHPHAWLDSDFSDCILFRDIEATWEQLSKTYNGAFAQLVYGNRPGSQAILSSLHQIKQFLLAFDQWKTKGGFSFQQYVAGMAA